MLCPQLHGAQMVPLAGGGGGGGMLGHLVAGHGQLALQLRALRQQALLPVQARFVAAAHARAPVRVPDALAPRCLQLSKPALCSSAW